MNLLSEQRVAFNVLDHLDYLRLRLVRALLAFGVGCVAGFFLIPRVYPYLLNEEAGLTGLVYLSPVEAFFSELKLALALGLVISLPFILYQLWALFTPAMNPRQRVTSLALLPAAYLLFVGGCLFAVLYVLPLALQFFLSFGGDMIQQEIAVGKYISFLIGFVLPFGFIFELPVVIIFCTRIGLLNPRSLSRNRKYVIFAIFVVAAIVTPADVVSQIALAIPLMILFEASLLLARWTAPKDRPDSTQAGTRDSIRSEKDSEASNEV